jgi:hypothetical protein
VAPSLASRAAATGLRGAAGAIAAARSYTFGASVTVGASTTRVTGEFQAPDRVHELITVGQRSAEVAFIGARAFTRDAASGRWSSVASGAAPTGADPRTAFTVLTQAEGTFAPAGITFRLPTAVAGQLLVGNSRRSVSSIVGRAVVAAGGLSHLEFSISASGGPVNVVLDYRDINTAPPVATPNVA